MIGKTISHYKILEKLGEGGMGIVYKAEDTKLKRIVALKFLPPELTRDSEAKERFIHEAQAAGTLSHTNIATIYGIDEHEGNTFIAMEFIEGQTLKEKIKKGPLKLKEAITIAKQIAEGLSAAHEKSIIHRDIKSANIMLKEKNQVKIMDFGLAKIATGSMVTKAGTTLGTIAYMSPEQAQGEPVDHRSDIFSFGVVLYEMIAGQLPFKGQYEQAIVYSILNEDPELLTAIRTSVPMKLEEIVNKLLAKDPDERYQHVDELPVDLKAIDIEPTITSGTSSRAGAEKVSQQHVSLRQAVPWSLVALIAVVAILIGAVSIWYLQKWSFKRSNSSMAKGPAVVVLMDTPAPAGVYDPVTLARAGTNADDLSEILRDLPIVLHKETLNARWDRETQVLMQQPDLILIHRSAFFHSMNLEIGFGYAPFNDNVTQQRVEHLYEFADDRLMAFMGHVGLGSPVAKFLIYSRGIGGGGWMDEDFRRNWVGKVESRFPSLKGRVWTMQVKGGHGKAKFRLPVNAHFIKDQVKLILEIGDLSVY